MNRAYMGIRDGLTLACAAAVQINVAAGPPRAFRENGAAAPPSLPTHRCLYQSSLCRPFRGTHELQAGPIHLTVEELLEQPCEDSLAIDVREECCR